MAASDKTASHQEELDFVTSALEAADKARRVDLVYDREVLENYLVLPPGAYGSPDPYSRARKSGRAMFVDSETHQMVETLLAQQLLSTVSDSGFVSAEPVGREDAHSSRVAAKLLERTFRVNGNFRDMYVAYKDAMLFSATVLWPYWDYEEGFRRVGNVQIDPFTGEEFVSTDTQWDVLKDDPRLFPLAIPDFFYDPSQDTVAEMNFGFRRFTIPRHVAKQMAERERWSPSEVRRALDGEPQDTKTLTFDDEDYRRSLSGGEHRILPDDYRTVVGYEGYARVPYKHSDGYEVRRLVTLNGRLVLSEPSRKGFSRVVPAFELVINPIRGRFRGVGPAHVARYTQDFTTGLLVNIATAVERQTRQPMAYDRNAGIDLAKLSNWNSHVGVDGNPNAAVAPLNYSPPLQEAFAMFNVLKQQMQGSSAAEKGLQGQGLGTKRFSATESQIVFQQQLARPQMMSTLFEREFLPALGKGLLEMYQAEVQSTEDLRARVGASAIDGNFSYLEDIHGDYDVKFVGSQQIESKEMKLQFIERAFQVFGSIPGAAADFPWAPAMVKWLELADLRELESMVARPDMIERFVQNHLQLGQQTNPAAGNGNNAGAALAPGGLGFAQSGGRQLTA